MIARICIYNAIMLLLCLCPTKSFSQQSSIYDVELRAYFKQFNNSLFGLIQVTKKGNTAPKNKTSQTAPLYQLIDMNCSVFEELDPNIPFERAGLSTEMMFQQIDEFHKYVRLQHQDIQFWVKRSCVRQQLNPTGIITRIGDPASEHIWVTIAEKIYEKHMLHYNSYIKHKKKLSKRSNRAQYQNDFDNIESKHKLILQIYKRLNIEQTPIENLAFTQKIKLNGRILFGNSSFNTNYTNLTSGEHSSGNVDIQLNAIYDLNQDSKVLLMIKNRKETLITPYNKWQVGAGYNMKLGSNHQFSVGGNYETYKDGVQSINDYGKVSINTQIKNSQSESFNYVLNYRFLDQVFDQIVQNSYSRHHVNLQSTIKPGSYFSIQPGLIYNLGNSENVLFEYSFINPSLIFDFDREQGSDKIKLSLERTDYSNLELRNNSRFQFEWSARKTLQNKSSTNNQIGIIYRNFSEAEQSNYLDIYSKSNKRNNQKTNRFMIRLRYFPNIDASSTRLDIRKGIDQGGDFYVGYDVNLRLQYPTEEFFFSRLDGFFKLGADINGIRLGPFLRWHTVFDLKNTELGLIDRDQNSYQYGVESSGYFKIAKLITLRYRASYDLNTVFSKALDPIDPTMTLDAELRHPKNFQFDLDLGVKVMRYLEVFAVANYFNHETDYEEDINTSFIMNNTGNRFKMGARINYK